MRQILFNSLPTHTLEKTGAAVFFIAPRIESCSARRQLPSCARLGQPGAAVPTQPLQRKSAFPVMIQAVHQRNTEGSTA